MIWLKLDRARLVWRRAALLSRRLEIDRLEVGRRAVRRGGLVEVVPGGDPVQAGGVEASPGRPQLVHGEVLLADVGAQGEGHGKLL